jgi:hypothetical protein
MPQVNKPLPAQSPPGRALQPGSRTLLLFRRYHDAWVKPAQFPANLLNGNGSHKRSGQYVVPFEQLGDVSIRLAVLQVLGLPDMTAPDDPNLLYSPISLPPRISRRKA